ncbi:hypothetical protein M885DRAFT_506345 [Pelagophyceae sp. CCMP2097]|nr:hypothetical protein M885DRAFT_506345 [Pelagophyceae sp. CCMP2097]
MCAAVPGAALPVASGGEAGEEYLESLEALVAKYEADLRWALRNGRAPDCGASPDASRRAAHQRKQRLDLAKALRHSSTEKRQSGADEEYLARLDKAVSRFESVVQLHESLEPSGDCSPSAARPRRPSSGGGERRGDGGELRDADAATTPTARRRLPAGPSSGAPAGCDGARGAGAALLRATLRRGARRRLRRALDAWRGGADDACDESLERRPPPFALCVAPRGDSSGDQATLRRAVRSLARAAQRTATARWRRVAAFERRVLASSKTLRRVLRRWGHAACAAALRTWAAAVAGQMRARIRHARCLKWVVARMQRQKCSSTFRTWHAHAQRAPSPCGCEDTSTCV